MSALFSKLLLVLVVVPLIFMGTRLGRRMLPPAHPLRRFLDRHGPLRLAVGAVLAFYAFGLLLLAVSLSSRP